MGGSGSTRWAHEWTKATVKQCIPLDMAYLYRKVIGRRAFENQDKVSGALHWTGGSSAGYALTWTDGRPVLVLFFAYTPENSQQQKKALKLAIVTTDCNYGGVRYWLVCPECQGRVRKLYMRRLTFACRKCHDLTYTNSQEAHRFDRLGRSLGVNMSILDESFKMDALMERWYGKEHLTRGERRKVASYLGVPLAQVRNKWYQPKTRLKRYVAEAKLERLRRQEPEKT